MGIYRAQSVKVQRIKTNLKSVFNTYIDAISYKILDENRFKTEEGKVQFHDVEKD